MSYRAATLFPVFAAVVAAQNPTLQSGTVPKENAEAYPVHAKIEKVSIGAEYLVHSFSGGRETFIAKDYLVVEVALFPARGSVLEVNATHFTLRINGGKQAIAPQPPQFVAASLKDPNWDMPRGVQAAGGAGPVIFGAPQPTERFPGDPNARTTPIPRAPDPNTAGIEENWPVNAGDLALQTSLPEGEYRERVSGYLYFPYRGKIKKIQKLELEFEGPQGAATLTLQ